MKKMKIAVLLVTVISFMGLLPGCDDTSSSSSSQAPDQVPVVSDYDISNLTQTAGSVTAVRITPKAGKSGGLVTISYAGSPTPPQAVGTYPVTFDVAAATGWTAARGLIAGDLTVNAVIPGYQTPVEGDFDISGTGTFVYDGKQHGVTVTAKAGKTQGVITVKYNGVLAKPQAVGTYSVTFDVTGSNTWYAVSGLVAGTVTITSSSGGGGGGGGGSGGGGSSGKGTPTAGNYSVTNISQGLSPSVTTGGDRGITPVIITPLDGTLSNAKNIIYVDITKPDVRLYTVPQVKGTYNIFFSVEENGKWLGANNIQASVNLTVRDPRAPTVDDYNIVGTGKRVYDPKNPTTTVSITPKDDIAPPQVLEILYNTSPTPPAGTGLFTVTFTVLSKTGWLEAPETGLVVAEKLNIVGALRIENLPKVAPLSSAGKAEPSFDVYVGDTVGKLTQGSDYIVSWASNTTFGQTATVTVTGVGPYGNTDPVSATFEVGRELTGNKDLFGFEWQDEDGNLTSLTSTSIFVGAGESQEIRVANNTLFNYFEWRKDGVLLPTSGYIYTFTAEDTKTTVNHNVTLIVKRASDGKYFSTNVKVTVIPKP